MPSLVPEKYQSCHVKHIENGMGKMSTASRTEFLRLHFIGREEYFKCIRDFFTCVSSYLLGTGQGRIANERSFVEEDIKWILLQSSECQASVSLWTIPFGEGSNAYMNHNPYL